MTAKEQVLKVYPDARKYYSKPLDKYVIVNKSIYQLSAPELTEQQAWESALAIINDKKEKK